MIHKIKLLLLLLIPLLCVSQVKPTHLTTIYDTIVTSKGDTVLLYSFDNFDPDKGEAVVRNYPDVDFNKVESVDPDNLTHAQSLSNTFNWSSFYKDNKVVVFITLILSFLAIKNFFNKI